MNEDLPRSLGSYTILPDKIILERKLISGGLLPPPYHTSSLTEFNKHLLPNSYQMSQMVVFQSRKLLESRYLGHITRALTEICARGDLK